MIPIWPFPPKMTGSEALPTSGVIGDTEPWTVSGPLTAAATTARATKLSMIVVTTSWAPETALRTPGMKPQNAPRAIPAASDRGMPRTAGLSRSAAPTATAPRAPIRNWPCAPMLNSPALNASPTDRPPSRSGAVATRVLRIARSEPTEPSIRAAYASIARPGWSCPLTSHSEKMMTSDPTSTDRTIEMTGRARMRSGAGQAVVHAALPSSPFATSRPPVAMSTPISFLSAVRPSRMATSLPR